MPTSTPPPKPSLPRSNSRPSSIIASTPSSPSTIQATPCPQQSELMFHAHSNPSPYTSSSPPQGSTAIVKDSAGGILDLSYEPFNENDKDRILIHTNRHQSLTIEDCNVDFVVDHNIPPVPTNDTDLSLPSSNKPNKRGLEQEDCEQGSDFTPKITVCGICGYAVALACEFGEHMKRHEKLYGCTFPRCHKRFGKKEDWMRHENSEHFQQEAFRCSEKSLTGQNCGGYFCSVELFRQHLQIQHDCSQPETEIEACKIGKNYQRQFWCGFHNTIIRSKNRRNAAWDERFEHIASHLERDNKKIEEWICVEENKTKEELLKGMDGLVLDDPEETRLTVLPPPPPPPSSFLAPPCHYFQPQSSAY